MYIRWTKTNWRIGLMTFSLILFFISSFGLYRIHIKERQIVSSAKQQVLGIVKKNDAVGYPVRLIIPVINVDASIQRIGVSSKGEMEVPSNVSEVGWFQLGSLPGEIGSAVIAGHLDGKNGEAGVFANLYRLKADDLVFIEDASGGATVYIVRDSRILNPGYAEDVFSKNDNVHLNLVTCDGVWDKNKMSYDKRLVVYTDGLTM